MKLTIGLPCYGNFAEVWFTVQALRLYHAICAPGSAGSTGSASSPATGSPTPDCEILIVDNQGDAQLEKFVRQQGAGVVRYEKYTECTGTSVTKNRVIELAKGDYVLCMDAHVMLAPGALGSLDEITPLLDAGDLVHGPMIYSDMKNYSCEWKDVWRGKMWGIWGGNVKKLPDRPFEIWGMGTGLFMTKKSSWLGFNAAFRGFGGEQGYIHEKYRKAGKKVWCHPKLVWLHLFERKVSYPLQLVDRVRNYIIGHRELEMDTAPVLTTYGQELFDKANALI